MPYSGKISSQSTRSSQLTSSNTSFIYPQTNCPDNFLQFSSDFSEEIEDWDDITESSDETVVEKDDDVLIDLLNSCKSHSLGSGTLVLKDESSDLVLKSDVSDSSDDDSRLSYPAIEDAHLSEEERKIQSEIAKMKRLDRILQKKSRLEKKVKRERKEFEKNMRQTLQEIESIGRSSTTEEIQNTHKYFQLLPAESSQTSNEDDIDNGDAVEPFFQTEAPTSPSKIHTREEVNDPSKSPSSKLHDRRGSKSSSTPSSGSKSHKRSRSKKDIINRNIKLAGDAASAVAMTDDEKQRLSVLLKGIEKEFLAEEDTPAFLETNSAQNGFLPTGDELESLVDIDLKLKALSDQHASSSTISAFENFSLLSPTVKNTSLPPETLSSLRQILGNDTSYEFSERSDSVFDNKIVPNLHPDVLRSLLASCDSENEETTMVYRSHVASRELVPFTVNFHVIDSSYFKDIQREFDAALDQEEDLMRYRAQQVTPEYKELNESSSALSIELRAIEHNANRLEMRLNTLPSMDERLPPVPLAMEPGSEIGVSVQIDEANYQQSMSKLDNDMAELRMRLQRFEKFRGN